MKHFLDTSVVRQYFFASRPYKKYFKEQFKKNPCYISKYVKMEFNRSYLSNIIDFYITLRIPSIESISDAISIWNEKFSSRELKSILHLINELLASSILDYSSVKDKDKALRNLESYIKRIALKIRKQFKDIGSNATRCTRAMIELSSSYSEDPSADIIEFRKKIGDTEKCQNECKIVDFVTRRFKAEIDSCIKCKKELRAPSKTENKGFVKIGDNLERIITAEEIKCTCTTCSGIGDAIITLELPDSMRLETLDYSFEHFCPILKKTFFRHPSHTAFFKTIAS